MNIIQWIDQAAGVLIALFVVGCIASYLQEARKVKRPILRWLEWVLLPPGYAALFIIIQKNSVRYFAFYPKASCAVCVLAAVIAVALVVARKKRPGTTIAWLGGLLGMPVIVAAAILLGMYLREPARFESVRTTLTRLESTEGQSAPDFSFSLVGSRGQTSLAAYRGRLVLLNVWATWCVPCLKEMPDLNRIQQEFGGKGLTVINLSDESFEKIETYLSKTPMITTHGRIDSPQNMPEFYQFGGARPASFLIDPAGKVIETVTEARNFDYFRELIVPNLPLKVTLSSKAEVSTL